MVKFTLKHCQYFDAVAEHGGIAQAARALNISQPAVAQGIERLEEVTGLTLFERRHARGTTLTVHGRAFRESVRGLLARAADVAREAAAIAADLAGTIRLGCFHTLAPFCLAQLAREHAAHRPGVALQTSEHRQDELVSALAAGRLDVGILYDMGMAGHGLRLTRLASLEPRVLLPATHRLARRRRLSLRELAGEPFVHFEGPGSSEYFRGVLAGRAIDPPIAMRCYSTESVRSAVGNGLGFSLTVMRPASALSHDGHELVSVAIADDVPALDIVLAGTSASMSSPLLAGFEAFCKDLFERLV